MMRCYYIVSVAVAPEGVEAATAYVKKFEAAYSFPGVAFQFLEGRAAQDIVILTLDKWEAMRFESAADASLAQSVCEDLDLDNAQVEMVDTSAAPSLWTGVVCRTFKVAETGGVW